MRAWSGPEVATLPVTGPPVAVHDTATGRLATPVTTADEQARMYVCGITPYDATHLGHAATYVGFDLLYRAWRNAGLDVRYVQNVTDVDDPLLERATKVGIEWQALAERETELFRTDMEALRVIPPDHYIGAVEAIPLVIDLIAELEERGATYQVENDVYYAVSADPTFGEQSHHDRETMLALFGERGGDPDRPGKRDPLDCIVWRGHREGEPSWESPYGPGRPGWHIECTSIALEYLGSAFDVQGGGNDLDFPHHEMGAGHAQAARPDHRFAKAYVHAGMVGYDGEKMSKSKGNLVFVSALRNAEVDPMAIRLALLGHHYRSEWEWTDGEIFDAVDTLTRWRRALSLGAGAPAGPVREEMLAALSDDLDAPRAVAAVERWVAKTLGIDGLADTSDPEASLAMSHALDAVLGLKL